MGNDGDAAVAARILAAKRVIADPSSSPFDIYAAREDLRKCGADGWQSEEDNAVELRRLQSTVADPNANPIEVYAARERLKKLGVVTHPPKQLNVKPTPPSRQSVPEEIARYHRGRRITLLALGALAVLLLYWVFRSDRTVDYYLSNYQERVAKLQECSREPDMTKDKECMNAYTAHRVWISTRR